MRRGELLWYFCQVQSQKINQKNILEGLYLNFVQFSGHSTIPFMIETYQKPSVRVQSSPSPISSSRHLFEEFVFILHKSMVETESPETMETVWHGNIVIDLETWTI